MIENLLPRIHSAQEIEHNRVYLLMRRSDSGSFVQSQIVIGGDDHRLQVSHGSTGFTVNFDEVVVLTLPADRTEFQLLRETTALATPRDVIVVGAQYVRTRGVQWYQFVDPGWPESRRAAPGNLVFDKSTRRMVPISREVAGSALRSIAVYEPIAKPVDFDLVAATRRGDVFQLPYWLGVELPDVQTTPEMLDVLTTLRKMIQILDGQG